MELGRYFCDTDNEVETWWFGSAPAEERAQAPPFRTLRIHRTLSQWIEMLCATGLRIEKFAEPRASEELAAAVPVVEDTQTIPLFLHIRARKS